MEEPKNEVVPIRDELDIIDGYERNLLDRDLTEVSRNFSDETGSLIQRLAQIFRRQGHIALLDAGCGTGHTLYDFKESLLQGSRQEEKPDLIRAVGVNEKDYSGESMMWKVRNAVKRGYLEYLIGDLETVQLSEKAFEVTYMYEVLFHNDVDKSVRIIKNILPSIKPKGLFWFNLHPMQYSDPVFSGFIEELKGAGITVFDQTYRSNVSDQKRTSARLTLP